MKANTAATAALKRLLFLEMQNEKLKEENDFLKRDSAFGIHTRGGLEIESRKLAGKLIAVFIDLDNIHGLNQRFQSQTPVDKLIRNAFALRNDDLILAGRWRSGDEVVFIVKANPQGFASRLQSSLNAQGLSATIAWQPIVKHDLCGAVEKAMAKVYAAKEQNKRGRSIR